MRRKSLLSFTLIVLFLISVLPMSALCGGIPLRGSSGASAAQSSGTDWWPMFHHAENHTGYSTSPRAPNTNQLLWKYTTGNWVASSPAVVNDTLYVGSGNSNVYALDARNGTLKWNTPTDAPVYSSPAIADGKVYVGYGDSYFGPWGGGVYCLYASNGTVKWQTRLYCPVESSPCVVGGIVFVGAYNNYVYALNATTGGIIWQYLTNGWVFSSPAVVGGVVFVGSNDTNVRALSASTGNLIWSFKTNGSVVSSPAVAGGVVFVGSCDRKVYALNASTGGLIWFFQTLGWVESSPAVFGGVVFVGSDDTYIRALNAATGQLIWSFKAAGYVLSSPAVADAKIYVGSYDQSSARAPFYCLNASDGAFIWSYQTNSPDFDGSPAIVGGVVYVGACSPDNQVYAFESNTTVQAYCLTQGAYVNVAITLDGLPTGFTTPHTFTNLSIAHVGTHTIMVPSLDPSGHPFMNWNTGETTTTITVSIAGFTYVAYYKEVAAGKRQLTNHTSAQDLPSLIVVNNQVFQGYFLAYQSWETGTANQGDIFVEKYDTNWNLLKRVQATNLPSYQDSPSLALVSNGSNYYLELAYTSGEAGDGYWHIFMQNFSLSLDYIAKKQMTSSSSDQDLPSLLFNSSMSLYLAYQSFQSGPSYQGDIYIEKLDVNLNLISSALRVTTETSYQDYPCLLYNNETGRIYVAYVSNQTGNLDIFAKQYDPNLNYVGVSQLTTNLTTQARPSLAPIYVSTYPYIQGFQMAYHSFETGTSNQRDIFVEDFNLSCSSLRKTQITNDQFYSANPSIVPSLVPRGVLWCPGYVVYVSNETGNWDIWLQQLGPTPPTTYTVHLDSLEYSGASYNLGTIVFDGVSYPSLPTDITKPAGTYSVGYVAASGYQFYHLQTSGSISMAGASAVTVSSAGTVTAVYNAIPPTTYSATIVAHCNTEGLDVPVAVTQDGVLSGFNTRHTFSGLTGYHTFAVPGIDDSGHAFRQWSTGSTSLTITVTSGGTYTTYYGAVQGAAVSVSPISSVAIVGRNTSITVNVANVANLYSWQIKLYFNSSSVNCTGASYPDYHIFAGKSFIPVTPIIGPNYIEFGASIVGSDRFDGSGTLCLINFTGLNEGSCSLQFDAAETFMLDTDLNNIPITTSPGLITVVLTSPLVGDITGPNGVPDGAVNMYDISLVAKYFDKTVPPAPSVCDVVPSGKIDMRDISKVASQFGQHYP